MESDAKERNDDDYALLFIIPGATLFVAAAGFVVYNLVTEGRMYLDSTTALVEGALLAVCGHLSSKRNTFREFQPYGYFASYYINRALLAVLVLMFFGIRWLLSFLPFLAV